MATFDFVFQGGGAKGVALSGGLTAFEERGHTVGRLVGTSAGAITAACTAVGFSGADNLAGSLVKTPDGKNIYSTFADTPVLTDDELESSELFRVVKALPLPLPGKWEEKLDLSVVRTLAKVDLVASMILLWEKGGMYRGDAFLKWMHASLESKGAGYGDATFAELFARTNRDLSCVTTDTTERRMLVLNHRTAPDLPVVWGVRMSMSIPFYWEEVRWRAEWGKYLGRDVTGHTLVDGGVVSNFALSLLADPDDDEVRLVMGEVPASARNPVAGLSLDADLAVPGQPAAAAKSPTRPMARRIEELLDTMMDAHDGSVDDAHPELIVRLPVQGYGTTEFDMSDERTRALYEGGRSAAAAWLEKRPAV
jgi:predicted acylesterase/phospholipase RssA